MQGQPILLFLERLQHAVHCSYKKKKKKNQHCYLLIYDFTICLNPYNDQFIYYKLFGI